MYEERQSPKLETRNLKPEERLTPDALSPLPAEWLERLKQGARRADFILLTQMAEQIRDRDATIADALTLLTEAFEYDKILALIQQTESGESV